MVNFHQHARKHVDINNSLGKPTPVAIVLGTDPTIGLCSVARIIYGYQWAVDPTLSKFTVIVDDDIDVWDDFVVDWAVSFRSQPAKDTFSITDSR